MHGIRDPRRVKTVFTDGLDDSLSMHTSGTSYLLFSHSIGHLA